MRKNISWNKITIIGYIICLIGCVVFCIYVNNILNQKKDICDFGEGNIYGEFVERFTGWKVIKNDGWDVKYGDDYKTIKNKLPQKYIPEASICFMSYQEIIEVFVDGKSIYKLGTVQNGITKSPGWLWNIITLPKDYEGKSIIIKVYDPYDEYKGSIDDIFIGSKLSHINYIVKQNLHRFIFSLIILIISIILILLSCFSKNIRKNKKGIIYLGVFLVSVSIWFMTQSMILPLLGMNPVLSSAISYISVSMVPLCFIMYIKNVFNYRHKNLTNILMCVYVVIFCTMIILQGTAIVDLKRTIIFSHTFFIIGVIESFRIILTDIKSTYKEKKKTLFCLIIMLIGGTIDLSRYYFSENFYDVTLFTRYIFMFNLFFMTIYCIKLMLNTYFEQIKENTYKQLAYVDTMTGLKNRNCFQEKIKILNDNLNEDTQLKIVVFDINGLKKINDKYGHLKGDLMIKESANTIRKTFDNCGNVYRIGGDEFCLIVENVENLEESIKKFEEILDKQRSKSVNERVIISYGVEEFHFGLNKDLYEVFDIADKNMYEYKKKVEKKDY